MLSTRVDGGLVAPFFDFISTNDRLERSILMGGGKLRGRFYIRSNPKGIPM